MDFIGNMIKHNPMAVVLTVLILLSAVAVPFSPLVK